MSALTNTPQPDINAGVPPEPPEAHRPAAVTEQIQEPVLELVDDNGPAFFAPVSTDLVDGLIAQYKHMLAKIEELALVLSGEHSTALEYFLEGNAGDARMHRTLYLERLFERSGAIKALNAAYWSKALGLTDVYDCMPQARRDEWNASIREHRTPDFEQGTVRSTLFGLLASRQQLFAERVDGIFRNLSREHVTNCPEGFGKRMIIAHLVDDWGTTNHGRSGYINDLRVVIARFMGRDEPRWDATSGLIKIARRRPGEWITVDAGAMRLRVYKKGTAHLEIHPDMAYRLNQILAHLYPAAIPSQFRTKPARRAKQFDLIRRPLSFAVVAQLASMRVVRERISPAYPERYQDVPNARMFDFGGSADAARVEATRVIASIGGVPCKSYFQFDYDPDSVIAEIVASGCIPDRVTHQFYATPPLIAQLCADLATVEDHHTCLEPSAGQGDLAAYLPKERTTCVEVSALHCAILKARGFQVHQADFIAWATDAWRCGQRFDRVMMNPPFSQGRALAHIEAAARLIGIGGRLVAVLPATMRGTSPLPGYEHVWSQPITDEFDGTGVSVVVLKASRLA